MYFIARERETWGGRSLVNVKEVGIGGVKPNLRKVVWGGVVGLWNSITGGVDVEGKNL